MDQIGVGLVGCGMIAAVHVAALKEIPAAKICGVWSRTRESRVDFAENTESIPMTVTKVCCRIRQSIP